MKPTALPPNPRLLDHVEHALQWLFCWLIVVIPGHPMISGLCTGTILGGLQVVAMYFVVHLATQHLHP
jgi:sterol desaturase/sphingolipid hydroxylase (fatty acid hydroxylase superfamily)